jgi:pimeloyl-ACP methyl ester carboxylesterase
VQPALIIGANADPIVSAAETKKVAALLPNAVCKIFPGSLHPLNNAPLTALAKLVADFRKSPLSAVRSRSDAILHFERKYGRAL